MTGNLKTYFHHPITKEPVFIFLDPCHMLKLVRNTIGDKKNIVDGNNEVISWKFIEHLHKLQQSEGLSLANRLKEGHLNFVKQKMKVKLAAQLMSESVADAIDLCSSMKLKDFDDSGATTKFIRYINNLFDILNSRNLFARGWKRPISNFNESKVINFVTEAKDYICNLKESQTGQQMIFSQRKTGFVGFLVCCNSALQMYTYMVAKHGLKFFPTYKISQDHLEMFFGGLRSKGGCNNNPTARQFLAAYKRPLVHNEIRDNKNGNCTALDTTQILNVSSSNTAIDRINSSIGRNCLLEDELPNVGLMSGDHDYSEVPDPGTISELSEKIIGYICGFIIRKLKRT